MSNSKVIRIIVSIRLHPDLINEYKRILADLENRYAYGNKTFTSLVETAMIRFVDYYWRKRKREKLLKDENKD